MTHDKVHHSPSDVVGENGKVIVNGPDGVAVTLTPEAALETAARLIEGAAIAHGDEAIRKK